MELFGNLGLKKVVVYILVFSVTYIIAGIITPALEGVTLSGVAQSIEAKMSGVQAKK